MCGIAGFADFKFRDNLEALQKMMSCMHHRGPDGHGHYLKEGTTAQIGLAHRRLSIIDLSNSAAQPMHYQHLSLVFNGEIYNYKEIRQELQALGHHFQTESDTEVVLHAWLEWQETALHRFRGMFAIVLYDANKNQIICIRDRAGVKPLYYSLQNDIFLFGSELKNLMSHGLFKKQIDPAAVASFLQYGYVSGPHTIFKNTNKLLPGHLLYLNLETREIDIRQYWNVYDYYNQPKLEIPLAEAVIQTEDILKEAFDYRMVADVPVGIFLSGGYDSTCLTSLLQKDRTDKLKTFTIGTENQTIDEAPFAREIAARLGTDHTEYYCTVKEALDIVPTLPFYYDEPFADNSAIPTMLVSKMARQQVTVALSADAGDEIFAGYNRYDYISRYGAKISRIPGPLRKMAAGFMDAVSSERIPVWKHKANFHSRYDKIINILRDPSPAELLKNIGKVFNDRDIDKLMSHPVTPITTAHSSLELKEEYYDVLSYMMAIDYQTYMVDDVLTKVDRATMSASLEGREPFLDQHIIEWAARLPTHYKYHKGTKKYILREIVHKYIPRDIMERPKMGFDIPVEQWLQGELKPLVQSYLSGGALDHGLFQKETVEQLLKDFYAGRTEKFMKIWHLLMFQMWYKTWMA